jgi:putative nucleotidyltransferase with HDIG domain
VLLDQIVSQLQIHACDVLLFDPYSRLLEFAAGRGFRTSIPQKAKLRFGEGPAGRAVTERKLVMINNLRSSLDPFMQSITASEDFVAYYAIPLIAKGQVRGILELYHRSPLSPDVEWLDFLEAVATQAAIAIDNAELFNKLQRSNTDLTLAYDATIEGWSRALELRDHETEGHTKRVTDLTLRLAKAWGLPEYDMIHIRRGCLLHDIGKMAIPDQILFKPGPLTEEEWVTMRQHPLYAYQLLSPVPYLRPALDIPYCHHEKWDGSGYPRKLAGEQIPLTARLFAVADIWDALRSDRPYRKAWPDSEVKSYISTLSGTHLDARVVKLFLALESR